MVVEVLDAHLDIMLSVIDEFESARGVANSSGSHIVNSCVPSSWLLSLDKILQGNSELLFLTECRLDDLQLLAYKNGPNVSWNGATLLQEVLFKLLWSHLFWCISVPATDSSRERPTLGTHRASRHRRPLQNLDAWQLEQRQLL